MPTAVLERPMQITKEQTVQKIDERAMQEKAIARSLNERISEDYTRLMRASQKPVATATVVKPVERVASAPVQTQKRRLFDNISLENGVYNATKTIEKPVEVAPVAPAHAEIPESTTTPVAEMEDDALPTAGTMMHRRAEAQAKVMPSLLSELSAKAKAVVAAVAFIIIVAIAVICVNTSVLSSLDAQYGALKNTSYELTQEYDGLRAQLEEVSSEEYVANFAKEHGMVRIEK